MFSLVPLGWVQSNPDVEIHMFIDDLLLLQSKTRARITWSRTSPPPPSRRKVPSESTLGVRSQRASRPSLTDDPIRFSYYLILSLHLSLPVRSLSLFAPAAASGP
eukprot:9495086-Pyramimonas_sp.AAC.1